MVSACTDRRVAREVLGLGAHAYVEEVFDTDYLLRVIAWALGLEGI